MTSERERLTDLALTLQHDVGKYVTRAARNLPATDIPAALLDMLVADLYQTDGAQSALSVYDARLAASGVDPAQVPPVIRDQLVVLMSLEAEVRAHHGASVEQARALAIAVDDACRAFVRALGEQRDDGASS